MIITARNPDRLHRAGLELGATTAAFDAPDFDRLDAFFDELPARSTTCWSRAPALTMRRLQSSTSTRLAATSTLISVLPLQVARNAAGKVRPGGTLLFMGGTGGRRTAPGFYLSPRSPAALPAMTKNLALELAPDPRQPDRRRIRRHTIVRGPSRRPAGRAPRTAPDHAANRTRRRAGRHRRTRDPPHDQLGANRRDLRHRRGPAARRNLRREGRSH